MFPSCGYFASFPCPFFVNGLCERPYCHFRHSKHDIEKAKEEVPSYSTDGANYSTTTTSSTGIRSSSPVDSALTSNTSTSYSDPVSSGEAYFTSGSSTETLPPPPKLSQEQEAGSFSIPSFTDNSSRYQVPIAEEPEQYLTGTPEKNREQGSKSRYSSSDDGPPALPTYLPTPKTPSLPAPQQVKADSDVPVYQPTPKRELKRRHGDRGKSKGKGTDLEYDPECNYSCGGLTSSNKGKPDFKDDALEYMPTKKKARNTAPIVDRKTRLSCESLVAGSPDAAEQTDDDDEMAEAEFSEEENDSEQTTNKMEEGAEEEGEAEEMEESAENFENIGDDDISSDDDFVDVPALPVTESSKIKIVKNTLAKLKEKTSGLHFSSKNKVSVNGTKSGRSDKTKNETDKAEHRRTSKDSTSKSSDLKQRSSSTSRSKTDKTLSLKPQSSSSSKSKTGKSDKSSSNKGTTSSSGSAKVGKKDSERSSSSSSGKAGQMVENSSKQKREQSSKTDCVQTKSKNASAPKISDKQPKNKSSSSQMSSSKKPVSSENRHSSSSSKHSSSSSDAHRRSSVEGKPSSGARQSSSDSRSSLKERHSSIERKDSLSVKRPSSESKVTSSKHSSSDNKSVKSSSVAKHSSSDSKASSGRHSGSDNKNVRPHSHSKSSADQKSESKQRSSDSSKGRDTGRPTKEQSSSKSQLHTHRKNSASDKPSGNIKAHKADSSSHHKGEKPSKQSQRSGLTGKNNGKVLKRMNSDLFGEDSDGGAAENTEDVNGDPDGLTNLNNASTSGAVEENNLDYTDYIHDSDFEDEDTFDECLRIFKEAAPQKKLSGHQEKKLTKDLQANGSAADKAPVSVPGKQRTAHKAAEMVRKPELQKKEKPRHLLSPTEVMHNRIMEMRRKALERAAKQAVQEQEVSSTSGSASASSSKPQGFNQGGEKKRVAHMPKPVTPPTVSKAKGNTSSAKKANRTTLAITASKTEKRVAHTPNLTNLKRPVIPASFGSKVPSNIRQRYLNLIIDECLKFCSSEETAYKRGLEEETGVYERSSNKNIYLRVAVNTITRLRAEAKESQPGSSKSQQRRPSLTQSHQATLGGSRAAKTSFTLHRSAGSGKKVEVVLTEAELYQKLLKYTMTIKQQEENGYPRPSPDTPGKAVVLGTRYRETDTLLKDNERTCSRCGKRFIVQSDGTYAFPEECVYHWTRAYPRKKSGFIQHIYNCCSSDTSSKGCQVAGSHVHEHNKKTTSLSGFMQTMPRSPPRDGNFGIYALDCEMVYTLGGLELARVTVVNTEGESVFESLVQPFNAIVDYNTRFSGLTKAHLSDVETTLTDVQAILLNLFSDKSILIGHSLESDLLALKLIHSTVVDTSVVFPHRLGPPYKRALKNLMLETFQKIIQADDGGHDSKEDAVACLQLMKWRIKEDSKRELRYS